MKKLQTLLIIGLLCFGCKKFWPIEKDPSVSKHGEDESHNTGKNCIDCHYAAGADAEGIFTVAGSMFGNTANGLVEIYADLSADPVMVLEIDQLGNAYTSEAITFPEEGFHVGVRNSQGQLELMEDKIFTGGCNLCHGTSIEGPINME